jgi:hypothetical protein
LQIILKPKDLKSRDLSFKITEVKGSETKDLKSRDLSFKITEVKGSETKRFGIKTLGKKDKYSKKPL